MKWILIAGVVLLVTFASGCGKSTRGHSAAKQSSAAAPLTADPQWIPDPDDVELVKTSSLDGCQQRTVEQQVDSYFGSPRWQAGADSQGRDFVNVSGIVTYGGKPTSAMFQFLIDKNKRGFKFQAFTIGGALQPMYVAGMTLKEMCASARRAPLQIFQVPPTVTH
ncbi:MAG: hypothetical protein ACRETQ_09750 [Gammaproteobacteria bacterium]